MSVNRTLLVVGYGSLLSGYGLMAERRGGGSKLLARDAWPVVIQNAQRGLAKPSSHGSYLAMDLEPLDPTEPIKVRVTRGRQSLNDNPHEVGGLLLEFEAEWAARISTREEYDSGNFLRLLDLAERAGRPLGEYLLAIAQTAAFNLDAYRRELYAILGYTSHGYIFHPIPLDDGRVAIAAIGSGFHFSGHPEVISKRREFNMDKLLNCGEALALTHLPMDREGQIGYFAECLLGGVHGVAIGDLMASFDTDAPWAGDLARHFRRAAEGERERFLRATSLDERTYLERFGDSPAPSLAPLLKLASNG
ncbi:MAG TPA: hypothetical protein VKV03_06075 [Candidatus Binataceae bacterium]|nr:hypothetical protein [Candidatus Binataceae bacterium]